MKKTTKRRHKIRILSLALVIGGLISQMSFLASATGPVRDKSTNTAFITHKSARWKDEGNYLAELTLRVNGTQVLEPLDVIIVLDRSGSMDMNYVQADSTGKYLTFASCPCLNQDHFYLEPTGTTHTIAEISNATTDLIYDSSAQTLTVYNEQDNQWVELSTSKQIHLYYEFGDNTLHYTPYHFTMDGDTFIRISKWDTADTRAANYPSTVGLWDHADENEGCFDRFMEAKDAVLKFSDALINAHLDNEVALIPFSIRDEGVVDYLNIFNNTSKNLRNWLVEDKDKYFPAGSGVTVDSNGTVLGAYSAQVGLTHDLTEIEDALDRLFTTPNTDYIYGLSKAYNMLYERDTQAKQAKRAVVVFISDGKPWNTSTHHVSGINSTVISMANSDNHIYALTEAITSTDAWVTGGVGTSFWGWHQASYPRHDINKNYLTKDNGGVAIGAPGMGAPMMTVGYMLDNENNPDAQASYDRLAKMASNPESFIKVTGKQGTTSGYLADQLLDASVFPGGRNSVLRDVISKYYYVPEGVPLPAGVTIVGSIATGQTVVWNIGDIYKYSTENEPTITIPLVLREQYRNVSTLTYYPTNADNPEPSLYDSNPGPDGPDTGAKLDYTDPTDTERYDTIGTPKLPVTPKNGPGDNGGGEEPDEPEKPDVPVVPEIPNEPSPPTRENPPVDGDITQEYVVYDEDDVPVGKWIYEDGQWVFIDESSIPLSTLPKTGGGAMRYDVMLFGCVLIWSGVILGIWRQIARRR